MKSKINPNLPIGRKESTDDYNPNIDQLARGKFTYERYSCNRFLRYTGSEVKTYQQVRKGTGHGDCRSHNIDFGGNITDGYHISIENNNSKQAVYHYNSKEELLIVAEYIVGKENASQIVLK